MILSPSHRLPQSSFFPQLLHPTLGSPDLRLLCRGHLFADPLAGYAHFASYIFLDPEAQRRTGF